jgi:hypothetical protein
VAVDAVLQWAGNFGAVAVDLLEGAAAGVFGVGEIPTWMCLFKKYQPESSKLFH